MDNDLSAIRQGRLRRLKSLIKKEFYQIIRDPSSILISVVLPMILLIIYGFGVSLDITQLKVGLVLEDTSPDAISFASSLWNSTYFDIHVARDRREVQLAMERGAIRGIVIVPSYFSSFRQRQDDIAPIQVIADGSETNTANFVQNYVAAAFQNWLQQEAISSNLKGLPQISATNRFWYNEELESRYFLIPGSLAIIMTLIGTLLTSLVVAREWERGTMEALISTPVSSSELLLGKFIPYFVLAMVSMTISSLYSIYIYGIPFRGSFFALILVTASFLVAALGVGLLVSTKSRNQFLASQIAMVVGFLPAFILSGFIFEINSMPFFIRMLTYIIPAKYFVTSLLTIFLVGDIWSLLIICILPMLIFGTILMIMTAKNTVKRLD